MLKIEWQFLQPSLYFSNFQYGFFFSNWLDWKYVRYIPFWSSPCLNQWSLFGACWCIKHCPDCPYYGFSQFRQAKTEIVTASKVAYRFLLGVTSNSAVTPESPSNSNRATPRFQGAWFKSLVPSGATGARPSSSSEIENQEDVVRQQPLHEAEAPLRQT